jgi:hypothetical protein
MAENLEGPLLPDCSWFQPNKWLAFSYWTIGCGVIFHLKISNADQSIQGGSKGIITGVFIDPVSHEILYEVPRDGAGSATLLCRDELAFAPECSVKYSRSWLFDNDNSLCAQVLLCRANSNRDSSSSSSPHFSYTMSNEINYTLWHFHNRNFNYSYCIDIHLSEKYSIELSKVAKLHHLQSVLILHIFFHLKLYPTSYEDNMWVKFWINCYLVST